MRLSKALILLGTFLVAVLHPGFANAELWLYVSTSKDGTEFYYNSDSVCLADIYDQNNFGFIVRTKDVFSESAAAETTDILRHKLPEGSTVASDIVTMQFNLHNRCRILDSLYFDDRGELLYHVPPPLVNEWADIPDDHALTHFYRRILRQIADNHDFYRKQKWYDSADGTFRDP